MRCELAKPFANLGIARHYALRHLVIRQTRGRANHGFDKRGSYDAPIGRYPHAARKHKPLNARIERAYAIGQALRQHRNDPTREVNRRAPTAGLPIKRGVLTDVVRHIGNRHEKLPPFTVRPAIHRVVKVLGIGAIDCDERQIR